MWLGSVSGLLTMAEGVGESGIASLSRQEVLELVYSSIATLGFSLVLGFLVLAQPARLRSVGTGVAVGIVGLILVLIWLKLGGVLPMLTIIGLLLPVVGTIAQDFLAPRPAPVSNS